MRSLDVAIRPMIADDAEFAARMTVIERWGYLVEDFRRLVTLEPRGCFVAVRDNRRIGMITTVSYGEFSVLGCLIVRKAYRGLGIGETLMQCAMDRLERGGVRSTELDGVIPALSLYRRLGFKDQCLSLRFFRPALPAGGGTTKPGGAGEDEITAFDRSMTRLDRRHVLERFCREFPASLYAVRDEGLRAYAFVRSRAEGRFVIAPFVAADQTAAERLLSHIVPAYSDRPLYIGVLESNRTMVSLLIARGFVYMQPSVRMYRGERVGYDKHVYGIISPEKG